MDGDWLDDNSRSIGWFGGGAAGQITGQEGVMPTTTARTRDDAQIRDCIETLARAIRGKDIGAVMAHYAPDIVTFDLMPFQTRGVDAYRKNFEAWFASVQGPLEYETHEVGLTTR